ncbi:fluoride efflux transporter CrcB [Alkalilacustris brevis]|uniref:fluoride efflux transporter CrcB n=1 Tax=Alkalilacustris brevis TaxID=2026338 RepID=UPI000E0DA153|nr:fluoride efflux transporter CrcB [Alkalilacustris brevis]
MFWTLTQVALGGAAGAILRYGTQMGAQRLFGPGVPSGTLFVNVLGSFLIGIVFVWLIDKGLMRHAPFLLVGVLGAYTTFSTFSLDALLLWERGLHGWAVGYALGSVILSLAAVVAGVWLARGWLA